MNAEGATARRRGLGAILDGRLRSNRSYLIEGSTSSGKTTQASEFPLAGNKGGQRGRYL